MAEIKRKGSSNEATLENLAKDEPIIQEVKKLAKLSLTEKELKEINDMFEGSSKRIQFILSNEKEYEKIQNVCQKIQNYFQSPLKIEAGITTAKMLAIGLATVAGGALVAFLAGPGLVTVGALEAVSVVTAGSAGAVGGAVTGAVVKKSLEEVIW